jgi:hypothetical protein
MERRKTQREKIVDYIRKHGSITPMDAFPMGITKLATRVSEMRRDGIEFRIVIEKNKDRDGKPCHYARYYLKEQEDGRCKVD